jgi:hypothetical protein
MGLWNVLWLDLYRKRFPLSIFGQCAAADSFALARKCSSAPLFTAEPAPAETEAEAPTAAKFLFNSAGCCDKCYGTAGITSGTGAAAAASEQERAKSEKRFMALTFAPIPLPESRPPKPKSKSSSYFCASPGLRHDWRRLFQMRYEVYCTTSSKNSRKKGDATDGLFQACNVIGCAFISKSAEAKDLHAKGKHPLLDPHDVWMRRSGDRAKKRGTAAKT